MKEGCGSRSVWIICSRASGGIGSGCWLSLARYDQCEWQAHLDVFASLAEYERSRLSKRTKAGLAAAKARGRRGGRPRSVTPGKLEILPPVTPAKERR